MLTAYFHGFSVIWSVLYNSCAAAKQFEPDLESIMVMSVLRQSLQKLPYIHSEFHPRAPRGLHFHCISVIILPRMLSSFVRLNQAAGSKMLRVK